MPQIKSITQNNITYDMSDWNITLQEDGYLKCQKKNINQLPFWIPKAEVEITYEKPQILKRPDGSVISVPDFEDYLFIDIVYGINYELSVCLPERFAEGTVFLAEDRHLAEKKAKQLTKQREIRFEIDTLNAEEGWVSDWRDHNQDKYYLCVDYDEPDQYSCNCEQDYKDVIRIFKDSSQKRHNKYMSEKTAETIIAKYSQDELKQYLGIIL
jgi:hypothetical protein